MQPMEMVTIPTTPMTILKLIQEGDHLVVEGECPHYPLGVHPEEVTIPRCLCTTMGHSKDQECRIVRFLPPQEHPLQQGTPGVLRATAFQDQIMGMGVLHPHHPQGMVPTPVGVTNVR